MPRVNKINKLPSALREELDSRIVSASGAGYEMLEMWLKSRGYKVSKSSIHLYGKGLVEKIKQARERSQARVVAKQLGIDIRDIHPEGEIPTLIVIRDRVTGWSSEITSSVPAVEIEQKLRELIKGGVA